VASKKTADKFDIYCRKCRLAYARKWYAKNRKKCVARTMAWNRKNYPRFLSNLAQYRKNNRDKLSAKIRHCRAKNPARFKNYDQRKRAKRIKVVSRGLITDKQWLSLKREYGFRCFYCNRRTALTLDHYIPLSKGGKHSIGNAVPACRRCNGKKWNKNPEQFIAEIMAEKI
jgi:5-methylcytosine-specific restriction endonuclease McrA